MVHSDTIREKAGTELKTNACSCTNGWYIYKSNDAPACLQLDLVHIEATMCFKSQLSDEEVKEREKQKKKIAKEKEKRHKEEMKQITREAKEKKLKDDQMRKKKEKERIEKRRKWRTKRISEANESTILP